MALSRRALRCANSVASVPAHTQGDAPMLTGRMMDFPLTLTHFLERSRTYFGHSEIVTRQPDKSLHRYTYADFHRRTGQLAQALARLGVKPGDRVASLCWNHYRHLELYFGVPCM